ncbi:MAG: D-alanine--D-alanine ligase [Candidatus Omnitrophica bacterium]|nr:D-alanine--D-alanine ligase [Candidatus Omnitrophota bacterium]
MKNGREKIAVLCGGPSCEREISLISGQAVFEALSGLGMDAVKVDPKENDFISALKRGKISTAFIALHGTFGEDGAAQALLEEAEISYTGSGVLASRNAFDKSIAQGAFQKAGILVPAFKILSKEKTDRAPAPFSAPFVVKPASSGSSVGVTIVTREADFEKAREEAFRYSDLALAEEYISGRELTVGILGDEVLPIVEVIPGRKFYDYAAKYRDTGTRYEFPARLDGESAEKVRRAAREAYACLGCEVMGRVDIIWGRDERPYVLEVNTIPGLTGKSLLPKAAEARGLDFPGLCVKILDLSKRKVSSGQVVKKS